MISCVTKQLRGNIVPISSLVQDNRNICLPHLGNSSTLSPKGFKLKANTLAEVRVMAAAFKFSFGKIVEPFLSGKDLISEAVINDIKLIPNCNGLLKGILHFQGKIIIYFLEPSCIALWGICRICEVLEYTVIYIHNIHVRIYMYKFAQLYFLQKRGFALSCYHTYSRRSQPPLMANAVLTLKHIDLMT